MTDYLFAHPSFLGGMARCLDLGDTLTEYNQALTGEQADRVAIQADWMAVGEDIRVAIGTFQAQNGEASE